MMIKLKKLNIMLPKTSLFSFLGASEAMDCLSCLHHHRTKGEISLRNKLYYPGKIKLIRQCQYSRC